jgi:hypothetical protein
MCFSCIYHVHFLLSNIFVDRKVIFIALLEASQLWVFYDVWDQNLRFFRTADPSHTCCKCVELWLCDDQSSPSGGLSIACFNIQFFFPRAKRKFFVFPMKEFVFLFFIKGRTSKICFVLVGMQCLKKSKHETGARLHVAPCNVVAAFLFPMETWNVSATCRQYRNAWICQFAARFVIQPQVFRRFQSVLQTS